MYLLISLKTLYKHQVEFLKFFPLLWIYYMFIVETLEYMQKLYFVWQRHNQKVKIQPTEWEKIFASLLNTCNLLRSDI